MERIRYEPQVKAAILTAVQEARKAGKSWAEALDAAKKIGYLGTEGGLYQFVSKSKSAKKAKTRKAAAPATAKKVKPGRKAKRAAAVKAPLAQSTSSSLDIMGMVQKAVTGAVVSALEGLLTRLKKS